MKQILALLNDESGATAIEYGLIAALISVGAIVALGAVGDELRNTFQNIEQQLIGAQSNSTS